MKFNSYWLPSFLALTLAAVTGCGNGLSTVSGKVTFNGEPLAKTDSIRGIVYLFPEGGTGAPAVGLLDAEGQYTVSTGSQSGVVPGPYIVTVSATEVIPAEHVSAAPSGRAILPWHYTDPSKSGLRVEVGEGSNEFDFDLEGTPEPPKKRRRR